MVICLSCGAKLGDVKYCPHCGSLVAPTSYNGAKGSKNDVSRRGKGILGAVTLVIVVSSVIGLSVWMAPGEESEPPPSHGELAFHIHNEYVFTRSFSVYLKGDGVPNSIGDWDFTSCNDDHVYCACIWGECDVWAGSVFLDPDSYFLMEIDLPFGSYDYEIEVGQTVIASGSVYLTEDDYRETESFYYYG